MKEDGGAVQQRTAPSTPLAGHAPSRTEADQQRRRGCPPATRPCGGPNATHPQIPAGQPLGSCAWKPAGRRERCSPAADPGCRPPSSSGLRRRAGDQRELVPTAFPAGPCRARQARFHMSTSRRALAVVKGGAGSAPEGSNRPPPRRWRRGGAGQGREGLRVCHLSMHVAAVPATSTLWCAELQHGSACPCHHPTDP